MTDILEILKIIEQGSKTDAPADITIKVIKQYCEAVMNKYNKDMEEEYAKNNKR